LTKLVTLQLDLASSDVWDFDAGWLYKMASVQHIECETHGTMSLDNRLTQLSKLKDLQVSVTGSTDDEWKMRYDAINWEALHQLTHISFAGPSLFDESILRLTSVDTLRLVSLSDFHATDDLTVKYLAMLAHSLAAHRPQVAFKF
jgi:hypothetical protein